MSNQSIEKFKKYLENQNDTFLQDGRRVEGIIRDLFPEEKTLISLLTNAWKAGVVAELRQTGNPEVTIAQFGDRLCQEYGLRESSALSAVRVWAYALRVTDVVPDINVSSTSSFISQPSLTSDTKKCPFCAEEVKKYARKCKHCHSDISDDATVNGVQSNDLVWQAEQKKQLSVGTSPVIATTREIGREGRFIAYSDGTVLDTTTNLMWAAQDNGSDINWSNAKSYCKNYRGGSYTDWRMPTMDELKGLYDETRIVKYLISTTPFQGGVHLADCIDLTGTYVWSSNAIGSESVFLYFLDGKFLKDEPKSSKLMRALPVRAYIVDGAEETIHEEVPIAGNKLGKISNGDSNGETNAQKVNIREETNIVRTVGGQWGNSTLLAGSLFSLLQLEGFISFLALICTVIGSAFAISFKPVKIRDHMTLGSLIFLSISIVIGLKNGGILNVFVILTLGALIYLYLRSKTAKRL